MKQWYKTTDCSSKNHIRHSFLTLEFFDENNEGESDSRNSNGSAYGTWTPSKTPFLLLIYFFGFVLLRGTRMAFLIVSWLVSRVVTGSPVIRVRCAVGFLAAWVERGMVIKGLWWGLAGF
jgi:hypothetical protein